jgi:hypothetical protein
MAECPFGLLEQVARFLDVRRIARQQRAGRANAAAGHLFHGHHRSQSALGCRRNVVILDRSVELSKLGERRCRSRAQIGRSPPRLRRLGDAFFKPPQVVARGVSRAGRQLLEPDRQLRRRDERFDP